MKTTLITIAILISFSNFSYAQDDSPFTKGSNFLNGSVSFSYTSHPVNDDKSNRFDVMVAPKYAKFIKDNWALGAELVLRTSSETNENEITETKNSSFGVGIFPFTRYYFGGNFFGELGAGVGTQKVTVEDIVEIEYTATNVSGRGGIGYSLFLAPNVALEPSVFYLYEKFFVKDMPDDYKESLSSVYFSIGLSAYF